MKDLPCDDSFLTLDGESRVVSIAGWFEGLLGGGLPLKRMPLSPGWLAAEDWQELQKAAVGTQRSFLLTRQDGIGIWAFVRVAGRDSKRGLRLALLPPQQGRHHVEEAHERSRRASWCWDLIQDAIIERDEQGRVEAWNPAAERLFGIPAAAALGRNRFQLLTTMLPAPLSQIVEQMREQGSWSATLVHSHPEGHQVCTACTWVLRRAARTEAVGVIEIYRDLGAPMLASTETDFFGDLQSALSESNSAGELASRALPLLARHCGWDAAEMWLFATPEAEGGDRQLCTPAGRWVARAAQTYQRHLPMNPRGETWSRTDFTDQAQWWTGSGKSPWKIVLTVPLRSASQEMGALVFYSTRSGAEDRRLMAQLAQIGVQLGQWLHRHAAEQRLRRSEERFRALLESAPDALVITDENGVMVMANRQSEQLFGWKREQLIGKRIEMLMPERFRFRHMGHRQGYSDHPHARPMGVGLELAALRADGTEFPVEISLSPIQIDGQALVASAIRDASERRNMERTQRRLHQLEMAQAEHLATLGELAAGMAHEIKNPLAGMSAALEVLASQNDLPAAAAEIMGEVQHQATRIRKIVDELLNYARPRPAELILADLNSTVEQAIPFATIQAQSRGVCLNLLRTPVPPVLHDPEQIHRVVLNLLMNAIDASTSGGEVEVTTSLTPDARGAAISVRDAGPGIAEKDLERIFVPFYTTKGSRGTGLGLSLCRRIAQLHGGTITATSKLGEGSCFTLTLPLEAPRESRIGPGAHQGADFGEAKDSHR